MASRKPWRDSISIAVERLHRGLLVALALLVAVTMFGSAPVEAYTCNSGSCGDCYSPPGSPSGTFGTADYQEISGDGLVNVCYGGTVPACSFGFCLDKYDPYPCPNSCPVSGQKRICIYNQSWTQRPTFTVSGAPAFITNPDGQSGGIRATFAYEFDSMYAGIYDGSCGSNFFNLEVSVDGGAYSSPAVQPQWEKGTWTPTVGVCKSNSAKVITLSYRARVNAVAFGCTSCDLSVTLA